MFGFTFQYDATNMLRYQVNADGEGKIAPLPIQSFIQYVRDAVRLYGDAAYDGNTIIVTYRSYGEEQYNSNVKNGITVFGATFQVTPCARGTNASSVTHVLRGVSIWTTTYGMLRSASQVNPRSFHRQS